jgi:hypothetical protein
MALEHVAQRERRLLGADAHRLALPKAECVAGDDRARPAEVELGIARRGAHL